jgi:hypothetical protein
MGFPRRAAVAETRETVEATLPEMRDSDKGMDRWHGCPFYRHVAQRAKQWSAEAGAQARGRAPR